MSPPPLPPADAAAPVQRLVGLLVAFAVLLLLGCVSVVSFAALGAFEREVQPAIEQEARVLGTVAAAPIEQAVALGIPFDELTGVEAYFDGVIAHRRDIAYLVLAKADGRPMVRAGSAGAAFEAMSLPDGPPAERVIRRDVAVGYDTALAIGPRGQPPVGWLHIGISRAPLDTVVADTKWDVLIVLLVGAILAVELLRYLVDRTVTQPLEGARRMADRLARGDCSVQADPAAPDEAGRLAAAVNALVRRLHDRWLRLVWLAEEAAATGAAAAQGAALVMRNVAARLTFRDGGPVPEVAPPGRLSARLPLFLFVVAEQLSTSFIPIRGMELARLGDFAISQGTLAAVPIAVFVAAVALATPHGGRLAARSGARDTIVIGCVVAGMGFLWASFARSLPEFALARGLCGIGYAYVSIACQAQMALTAGGGRMARSLGSFTGAVMTGAVCGTAIGAVMADRIGYDATFQVSVALVLVVLLLALRTLPRTPLGQGADSGGSVFADARLAVRSPAFAALVLCAAVPAKVVLAGFVFYLAPLALRDAGLSQAAIGRTVMLYGFCMLPAIVLGGWLADKARLGAPLIWGAAVANGAVMLLPILLLSNSALSVAVALTGVAQGLASAPMLAMVSSSRSADSPPTPVLLAFLRLGERIGSVIGPFLAAWLLALGGTAHSVAWLGAVSAVTGLAYAAVIGFSGRRGEKAA